MTEPLSRLPTLSRRTLLAGAGGRRPHRGHAAVRAAGLRWDGEAEIVIVGSGGAGVSAALAARERTRDASSFSRSSASRRKHALFWRLFKRSTPKDSGPRASRIRSSGTSPTRTPRAAGAATPNSSGSSARRCSTRSTGSRATASSTSPSARRSTAASFREATCRSSPTRQAELHRRAARRLQKPRHRDPDFKPRPLPRAQRGRFGRRSRMARRFGHEVYAQGLAGRRAGFGRVFGQRRALPPA